MDYSLSSFIHDAFQRMISIDEQAMEAIKEILNFGCMGGSAIGSPVLSEHRIVWCMDVLIFAISFGVFVFRHPKEIKKYGPLFLPIACLFCLAAFGLAGTSIRELIADIPIALCLFILITAYSLPRFFPSLMEPSHLEYQIALEEGLLPSTIGLPRGPGSIQTTDDSHFRDGPLMDRFIQEQGFPYLTRSPSPRLRMPSIHGSDIDLDENMEPVAIALRRWVSPARAEAFSGLSKISSPDPGSPPKRFVAQPSETPHHSHGYATSSVESNAIALSLSSTADPDSPLLQKGKAGPSTLQST